MFGEYQSFVGTRHPWPWPILFPTMTLTYTVSNRDLCNNIGIRHVDIRSTTTIPIAPQSTKYPSLLTSSRMRVWSVNSSQSTKYPSLLTSRRMRVGYVNSSQSTKYPSLLTSSRMRVGSVNSSQAMLALFLSPPDNPGIIAPPTAEDISHVIKWKPPTAGEKSHEIKWKPQTAEDISHLSHKIVYHYSI